jgi:hypothetical protein
MHLVTFTWPAALRNQYDAVTISSPFCDRPLTLTPDCRNRSIVDLELVPLVMLLDAGFRIHKSQLH